MIRKYLRSSVVMMTGVGLGFLVHMGLAQLLGAAEYGAYNFIYALSSTLAILALFGFETSNIRFVSGYLTKKKTKALIRPLVRFSWLMTAVLALVIGGGVYGALYGFGLGDKYSHAALLIGFVLTLAITALRLHSGVLRGFHLGTRSIFYEITWREILMLSAVALAFGGVFILSEAETALTCLLGVIVAGALLSGRDVFATMRREEIPPGTDIDTAQRQDWLKTSFPMLLMVAAKRLLQRIDIIVLGFLVESVLLGAYSLAVMFADGATLASRPTLSYFSPKASEYFKTGKTRELRALFLKATGFIAGIHVAAAAAIALIVPHILVYFEADFAQGYTPLLILLCGIVIGALCGPVGNLLIMTRYEKEAMMITFATALGNIILNPILIFYYSIEGAAISTALLIISWNLACLFVVWKKGLLKP